MPKKRKAKKEAVKNVKRTAKKIQPRISSKRLKPIRDWNASRGSLENRSMKLYKLQYRNLRTGRIQKPNGRSKLEIEVWRYRDPKLGGAAKGVKNGWQKIKFSKKRTSYTKRKKPMTTKEEYNFLKRRFKERKYRLREINGEFYIITAS